MIENFSFELASLIAFCVTMIYAIPEWDHFLNKLNNKWE